MRFGGKLLEASAWGGGKEGGGEGFEVFHIYYGVQGFPVSRLNEGKVRERADYVESWKCLSQ
jgi:hypothetical protein